MAKTWLNDYRYSSPGKTPIDLYFEDQQRVINSLAPCSVALIAADATFVDTIYGFAVGKHLPGTNTIVMHYLYTRPAWRRLGIARALVEHMGFKPCMHVAASHWTTYLDTFAWTKHFNFVFYHPGLIRNISNENNVSIPHVISSLHAGSPRHRTKRIRTLQGEGSSGGVSSNPDSK